MSEPFDIHQFPGLPPEVVKAFKAQQIALESARFEATVERAARQHEQAIGAEKDILIPSSLASCSKGLLFGGGIFANTAASCSFE